MSVLHPGHRQLCPRVVPLWPRPPSRAAPLPPPRIPWSIARLPRR